LTSEVSREAAAVTWSTTSRATAATQTTNWPDVSISLEKWARWQPECQADEEEEDPVEGILGAGCEQAEGDQEGDAVNSIDRYEMMLWFKSRGDECLNCSGTAGSVLMRSFEAPLVIRIHK
jgi:hypothetical protein